MLNENDVKDKNIKLENYQYRATVCYYNGESIDCGLFETLWLAQKVLTKFPPDVWDGFSQEDSRYKEPDNFVRKTPRIVKTTRRKHREFGRTFAAFT